MALSGDVTNCIFAKVLASQCTSLHSAVSSFMACAYLLEWLR